MFNINFPRYSFHYTQAEDAIKSSTGLNNTISKNDMDNATTEATIFDFEALPLILNQTTTSDVIPQAPLEPSHIGPNGINVVTDVPLSSATWSHDEAFVTNLFTLFGPKALNPAVSVASSTESLHPSVDALDGVCSDGETSSSSAPSNATGVRPTQSQHWNQKLSELIQFRKDHGHCLVPLSWKQNPSLAHWVKRQRYQYNLKAEGKHSTMTPEREDALEALGFIWDSHAASWEERWNELSEFKQRHGHCNVPTKYPENPQLSVWVKCQRRQFKLLVSGKKSSMTRTRISRLLSLGFVFDPRAARRCQG